MIDNDCNITYTDTGQSKTINIENGQNNDVLVQE